MPPAGQSLISSGVSMNERYSLVFSVRTPKAYASMLSSPSSPPEALQLKGELSTPVGPRRQPLADVLAGQEGLAVEDVVTVDQLRDLGTVEEVVVKSTGNEGGSAGRQRRESPAGGRASRLSGS